MTGKVLDCCGLLCPLPVLRARKVLKDLSPGTILEVHATDPAAPADFRAFCEAAGHTFLEERTGNDGAAIFLIRRGVGP